MSSQASPQPGQARPLAFESFDGNRDAAPQGPRVFEPLDLSPPRRQDSPDEAAGRMGFIPLLKIDKQEDPRETARREAERMKAEAGRMVSEAQGQVESLTREAREQGYQAGYDQGLTEGKEAAAAMMAAAAENLARAVEVLDQARARVMAHLEREVVALVAASTDLVLMTPGAVKPELIKNVVRRAIEKAGQAERLTVRLHPEDLDLVQEFRPELAKGLSRLQHLDLEADADLGRGECLVEAPLGQVDATLDTRRRQLWQVLEETLHQDEGLDLEPLTQSPPPSPQQADAPPAAQDPAEQEQAALEEEVDW